MNTALAERALHGGLAALSPGDKGQLLADPASLSALHWAVWTSAARHPSWKALTEGAPVRARGMPDRDATPADPQEEHPSVAASDAATGG
jgi:hypothetical protein